MQSKSTPYTLTDGATVAVDWNNSHNQEVTVAGNRTLTFSNGVSGQTYRITIIQDGTGSRTISWPASVVWAGGSAPTLTTTANYRDFVVFYFDGTSYRDEKIVKNFAS